MKIAIDVSPLSSGHKVRGVGFYIEYLKRSLLEHFPENRYQFFTKGNSIEKATDIVHYPYFEPFFLSLPVTKRHIRVVTVHDLTPIIFPQHFPPGLKGRLRWQIQKYNLRRSDGIITDSYASQKDIVDLLGIKREKIKVVYLAAGEEFKKIESGKPVRSLSNGLRVENLRMKYNLPEKFVLYVGDATWNKNLPRLVKAIKEINLTLVMVGKALADDNIDRTNPWNKDLVQVRELIEGDKRFIRLGFISSEELVALYNIATIFVMPSIYEGFGLPVVEAMQCGCPAVTSQKSSLTEIAGEAAYYIDPFDTQSIANGIGEVFFSGKLRNDLSEKGLKQVKKFSWKNTAEETIRAYEKAQRS